MMKKKRFTVLGSKVVAHGTMWSPRDRSGDSGGGRPPRGERGNLLWSILQNKTYLSAFSSSPTSWSCDAIFHVVSCLLHVRRKGDNNRIANRREGQRQSGRGVFSPVLGI